MAQVTHHLCPPVDLPLAHKHQTLSIHNKQMMATMSCAKLHEMLRALFPCPCKQRYTAVTMMPRPPGLLGSLAFKWVAASSSTKVAVAAGALTLLAAGVTAAVVLSRRRGGGGRS